MPSRRKFLSSAFACATLAPRSLHALLENFPSTYSDPSRAASDEDFWTEIARSFHVDRNWLYFNNGGVSATGHPAFLAHSQTREYVQGVPSQRLWHELRPKREAVRKALAEHWGIDSEELALVRNTSEGLQICQMGLDFQTGDEVITTTQDYPRMLTAWKQRERRDGIVLKQVKVPIPCSNPQAVVDAYEKAITPKTRLLMICHMINLTGQILPVARVCEMARKHGVQVMVDGAHGFAHFPFKMSDLGADYYATSLHKWLAAPIGTGLLWMKKEHISKVWPLLAANEGQDLDIRKFEETGTSPIGGILAVMQALDLHKKIGDERKAARLRWLRDRWIAGLEDLPGFKLLTNLEPEHSCGIATFSIEGMGCTKLHKYLIRNRIVISPILHPEMEGVRVSPSIYSTAKEVDRFVKRIRYAAKHGLD